MYTENGITYIDYIPGGVPECDYEFKLIPRYKEVKLEKIKGRELYDCSFYYKIALPKNMKKILKRIDKGIKSGEKKESAIIAFIKRIINGK